MIGLADLAAFFRAAEIQRDPKVKLDKLFKAGDPVRARIIKIDPGDKKIGLSTRDVAALTDEERAQMAGPAPKEEPAKEEPAKEEQPAEEQPAETTPQS